VSWKPRLLIATAITAMCFGRIHMIAQQPTSEDKTQAAPATPKRDEIDILGHPAEEPAVPALRAPALPEVKVPNYVTMPIAELQKTVRELHHLKTPPDQSQLIPLLDKVGAKTLEIARKTPNLISHESVISEQGQIKQHQNFSFLVLQHLMGHDSMVFDEYRIDLASGEKFQTEETEKAAEGASKPQESQRMELPITRAVVPGAAPESQGFVNSWVHFYPPNRFQSEFRYLGDQQMNGHLTHVLSFAQKPGTLKLPATIAYGNKTYPMYLQGIAWVDVADDRIVRLRTDILFPPPGVPLRQLTADIQFEEVRIAEVATPLWLPHQVVVTSNLAGDVRKESHLYSDYRLFGTRSKIVLQ